MLRPEIIVVILVAIAAIVFFGMTLRRRGKREEYNKPSDVSVEREMLIYHRSH
jgi:FtsZ-interacting cell division protein ZipA